MRIKKYYIEQHDSSDCGAACIAMISKYYGKDFSITKLRDVLGTDIQGTTLKGLCEGSSKLGFESKIVRITRDVIKETMTLPAICHIRTSDGASHFIVLMKNKGKELIFLDPARGIVKYDIDKFFTMFDGLILFIYPTKTFNELKGANKSTLKTFSSFIFKEKKLFVYSFIASIFLTFLGIFFSLFNKILMDEVLPYALIDMLIAYSIGFGAVLVVKILLSAVRGQLVLYLSQRIDLPLMTGYFRHVFKLPINFFASRKIGDVTTRFQDAFTVKSIITNTALTIVIDIILAIVTAIIMIVMNVKLFIVILIITVLSVIIIYSFKGIYKKLNKKLMEQNAKLNGNIIESLKGIETVKVNANENRAIESMESDYVKVLKTSFKQGSISNVQSAFSGVVNGIGNLVLMALGVYFAIKGQITIGTVLAFFTIAGYFLDPIGRLIEMQLSIQEASISLRRLAEIYDIKEEEEEEKSLSIIEDVNDDITIKDLTFSYGTRSPVLKNINLSISKGEKVALVGESGSGKTTLSKLLLKFYKPNSGNIFYGDKEILTINAFSLREKIGYVPQNIEMFSGSISHNIRMGKENATQDEINHACSYCGCNEFINRLPYGYDSFLDENGGGLSGGEKQRLAFARAIVKKPKFIILDEATSNLDFSTEAKIYDTIFNKEKNTTMLIIAHRLSTIKNCDKIIVFSQGEIVESGKHDELLAKKGAYYTMWQTQSGNAPKEKISQKKPEKKEENVIEYN